MQQVTAREGRPIVICEKDDVETKNLAWQTIDVPHTVDCLQVFVEFKYYFHIKKSKIFYNFLSKSDTFIV